MRPGAGIRRRITARRAADWRLIDEDRAAKVFGAREFLHVVKLRRAETLVEAGLEIAMEDLIKEGRLARTRDAGNAHQLAQRDINIEILDGEFIPTAHFQLSTICRPTLFRDFDARLVAQIRERP